MGRVSLDPNVIRGEAYIEGTQIPIRVILDLLNSGESIESILMIYPDLTEEDVWACIDYAMWQTFEMCLN